MDTIGFMSKTQAHDDTDETSEKKKGNSDTVRVKPSTRALLQKIRKASGVKLPDLIQRLLPDARLEMMLEKIIAEKQASLQEMKKELRDEKKSRKK